MTLRLSKEDQAEYERLWSENDRAKEEATLRGDTEAAKRARRANTALYQVFQRRQLPPPPPDKWEIEDSLSIEARLERIEEHLKIGRFADDF